MPAKVRLRHHTVKGITFVGLPDLSDSLRAGLAKKGHRRTFKKRASIYLPGKVKNALFRSIERAEAAHGESRAYICPYEYLIEELHLAPTTGNRRRRRH